MMNYEKLASALEQIADKVTTARGLKAGLSRSWHDESGEVILVLMDAGLVHSTIAGWRDVTLFQDLVAGRTTDADHQAHAAKLCRVAAEKLRAKAGEVAP